MPPVSLADLQWAQLAVSLMLAAVFAGYWHRLRQTYLRYWMLSFAGLAVYQAALVVTSQLRAEGWRPHELPMQLAALLYVSAGFFQWMALLAGTRHLQRPGGGTERLRLSGLLMLALLLGLALILPWASDPAPNVQRLFLRNGLRFLLMGAALLLAAWMLLRPQAGKPIGQWLVGAAFALYGSELLLIGGLSTGYLSGSVSPWLARLTAVHGLFELVMVPAIGLALVIWLLADDRQRTLAALRHSEARLKLVLWGSGVEVWDIDLQRQLVWRDNALPGVGAPAQSEPMPLASQWQYLPADQLPLARQAFRDLVKGRSQELDQVLRFDPPGQASRWLRLLGRVAERDASGRARRLVGMSADVSELKRQERLLEERVRERTEALTQALAHLQQTQAQLIEQEKLAALGSLVAGVAHEINTPLGVSVTAASHLREAAAELALAADQGRLTKTALKRFLEGAEEACQLLATNLERANTLVQSFKQVATDQSSETPRLLDLGAYLHDVTTALRPLLRAGRHTLSLEVEPGIRQLAPAGAIYQLVANLMQNAVRHGFEGRSGGHILLRLRRVDDRIHLHFSDDGLGMSDEVRRRAFEPFFTTQRHQGGSGLGLHIAYNLVVRVLGGQLQLQTAPGQGTHFDIDWPASET